MSAEPQSKKTKMSSTLDQLKQITTIVADTGDFEGFYFSIFFVEIFFSNCAVFSCSFNFYFSFVESDLLHYKPID